MLRKYSRDSSVSAGWNPRTKLCKSRTTYSGTTYCSQFATDSMAVPKSWTQAPVYSSQGLQAASWVCPKVGYPWNPMVKNLILHNDDMAFLEAFRIFGQTKSVLRMWRCHEATVRPGVVMTAPGAQGTAKIDHSGCWGPIYWMMFTSIWVWVNTYRYIFRGMNIHLPAIWGFTRCQGFDPFPYVRIALTPIDLPCASSTRL